MDAKNIGVTALGRMIDEPKQNVDRWRKGEQRLKPEMAAKIAPHLNVSVNKLLLLPEIPETAIAGRVGAGGAIQNIDDDDSADRPRVSLVAGDPWGAATISGDSLGLFEGWYAIISRRDAFHEGLYGKLCVVGTKEGETLIKWVEKSRKKGVRLISGDGSIHADGIELEWAAIVVGMRPNK